VCLWGGVSRFMFLDTDDIYNNWYVLYVTTGKELFIKNTIQQNIEEPVTMTFFQREIIHKRRGKRVKVWGALFAGYIFVHERLGEVLTLARKVLPTEWITPVSVNNKPCMVYREEMEVLMNSADSRGLFHLSGARKVNDQIQFTYGALKNFQGRILWIDEKKHKARVEVDLFRRKIKVTLGVEIIKSASLLPCA
jgi:transcription antitermination factor NusG